MKRGYYGIGIFNTKTEDNVGMLLRSAHSMGAQFVFTIGKRYKKVSTDTSAATRHIPLFHYDSIDELLKNVPQGCELIGVELSDRAIPIQDFKHPQRAIYLLGAEDSGIPQEVLLQCKSVVQLPGKYCLNVAVAGSIIMYDRIVQ